MTEEKILTLHPQGKKGVNILKRRYEAIKRFIMSTLKNNKEITYQELNRLAVEELKSSFDGKVGWYVVSVKLDLEARNIIERVANTSPHKIRLSNTN
ncbi:DUF6958 family protein [Maribacter halichondriae]|uniref:DUF6958 family protein n=1 Tax=Maribacter halichondriae TaxID=2980554 RepID=UPI002358EAD5|nr:hypothetical protein [Maribacter sp. Hal144]